MKSKPIIVWTFVAETDLREIISYISSESPATAQQVLKKIREKTKRLVRLPESGRVVPELLDQGISVYRELVISPWRLIYRISGKTIYVLSVIDSRRNVEDILLKRLIG